MVVIEARGIRKVFGAGEACAEVLRGVDMRIAPGEYVAIMGASGSGKSTLVQILAGIQLPTSGQVLFEGLELAALNDDERTLLRRRQIGMVFQSFNLLPTLSAEDNVALPMLLDHQKRDLARQRAVENLTLVGLAHRRHHIPSALSGGEQQRVAIARSLAISPTVLLADEPTGNLDATSAGQIIGLLRRIVDQQHLTVVLVTHHPRAAASADRVLHFQDGSIRAEQAVGHRAADRGPGG